MGLIVKGKRIICLYTHNIMRLKTRDFRPICDKPLDMKHVDDSNFHFLEHGSFAIANMKKLYKQGPDKATGYLFFKPGTQETVGYMWVVKRGGCDISYRISNIDAFYSCVCVRESYRGQNYINRMLEMTLGELADDRIDEVYLGVKRDNFAAIRAYEKAGFICTGQKRYLRVLRRNIPYYSI